MDTMRVNYFEDFKKIEILDNMNLLAINDILDFLIENTKNNKISWNIKNSDVLTKDCDNYVFSTYLEYKGILRGSFEVSKGDCSHIKIRNMTYSYTDSGLIFKTEELYNTVNNAVYNQIYGCATDELQKLSTFVRGLSKTDSYTSLR